MDYEQLALCTQHNTCGTAVCGGGSSNLDFGAGRRLMEIQSLYGIVPGEPSRTIDVGHVRYVLSGGAEQIRDPDVRNLYEFFGGLGDDFLQGGGALAGMRSIGNAEEVYKLMFDHHEKTTQMDAAFRKWHMEHNDGLPENHMQFNPHGLDVAKMLDLNNYNTELKRLMGGCDQADIATSFWMVQNGQDIGTAEEIIRQSKPAPPPLVLPDMPAGPPALAAGYGGGPTPSYGHSSLNAYRKPPARRGFLRFLLDKLKAIGGFLWKHKARIIAIIVCILLVFFLLSITGQLEGYATYTDDKYHKASEGGWSIFRRVADNQKVNTKS